MRQIRRGVFETNSSSTHSLTMCSEEEYDRWEKGELVLVDSWSVDENFITREEAINFVKEEGDFDDVDMSDKQEVDDILRDYEYISYDKYWDNDELEGFEDSYTTPSGEKVIAFGLYGWG